MIAYLDYRNSGGGEYVTRKRNHFVTVITIVFIYFFFFCNQIDYFILLYTIYNMVRWISSTVTFPCEFEFV